MAASPIAAQKIPFSVLKGFTNQQIFDMTNAYSSGQFNRVVSNGTNKWFGENGSTALTQADLEGGTFFSKFLTNALDMAVEKFDVPVVNTKWENSGIVEHYSHPEAGIYIRRAGRVASEVTPGFLPENANSSDPDKYSPYKPRFVDDVEDRYFKIGNDNFQAVTTYQDFAIRPIVNNPYGLGSYIMLKINSITQAYRQHREVFYAKTFMHAFTDNYKYQLRKTQVLKVDYPTDGTAPTQDQSKGLFNALRKTVHTIEGVVGTTGEFNEAGYQSSWNRDDFALILRTGIEDDAITRIPTEFFRDNAFSFPFDQVTEMNDFGELEAYADSEFKKRLYPVYSNDGWGSVIDNTWNPKEGTTFGAAGQIVDDGTNVFFKDPYADVLGFIVQKGRIFDETPNGLIINSKYNERTLATSIIASAPQNGTYSDYYYNLIVIKGGTQA
jgi:hypothetical protein